MPSDLSVSAFITIPAARVPEETPVSLAPLSQASLPGSPQQQVDHPNPTFSIAPALGIVVIQFRNQAGEVSLSIPNQKQLDAYEANPLSAHQADGDAILA